MGMHVARFERSGEVAWGVATEAGLRPIPGSYDSLADFLERGREAARQTAEKQGLEALAFESVRLLGPVTAPCNVVCQGLNYGSHRAESGSTPGKPPFNMLFMKAASSLSGPYDDIVRPPGVRLLDYELELGLVIGAAVTAPTEVRLDDLTRYVAGIVLTNDVSARDVQIPQGQWFKGKSFRTFTPTGPYLYLLEPGDAELIYDLDLCLEVNGEARQQAHTSQLLFGPEETLTELSGLMDLRPGDLIQTGTPGGVALDAPSALQQRLARILMSERRMMRAFVDRQTGNSRYLQDGDVLRLKATSRDGTIDLGVMETKVVAHASDQWGRQGKDLTTA